MADAFDKERDKQLSAMEAAELAAVAEITARVNQLRSDTVARIAEAGELSGRVATMRHVENSISRQVFAFERDAVELIAAEIDKAFRAGVELVDAPVLTLGIASPHIGVSQELLTTAKSFSADLIKNITADVRIKINSILRRAAVGAISTQEAITEVGRSLESPGVFRSIAARSATIVRTEVLRIYSMAANQRMLERARILAESGHQLMKSWLTANDWRVRPSHIVAGATYADPILVDQPFIVGGESCQYPRDWVLSAEESCNCRCSMIPVVMAL